MKHFLIKCVVAGIVCIAIGCAFGYFFDQKSLAHIFVYAGGSCIGTVCGLVAADRNFND